MDESEHLESAKLDGGDNPKGKQVTVESSNVTKAKASMSNRLLPRRL